MDQDKISETWKRQAQKDIIRAERCASFEDWEQVVYHCQQALEKLSKAIYCVLVSKNIPFYHKIDDIVRLFEGKLTEPVGDMRYTLLAKLSQFYFGGRYPDVDGEMLLEVEREEAEDLFAQTRETFIWLMKSLPIMDSTQSEQSTSSSKP
jgi:HEPN domain-containing protein